MAEGRGWMVSAVDNGQLYSHVCILKEEERREGRKEGKEKEQRGRRVRSVYLNDLCLQRGTLVV